MSTNKKSDKKRHKSYLKLKKCLKNLNLPHLELTSSSEENWLYLAISNGGQKCGVPLDFLENYLVPYFSDISIIQPRNETFALFEGKILPNFNEDLVSNKLQDPIIFTRNLENIKNPEKINETPSNSILYLFNIDFPTFKNYKIELSRPPGLNILYNQVSENQEKLLIEFIEDYIVKNQDQPNVVKLKNRTVIHFGHDFDYDMNGSTENIESYAPIPTCFCEDKILDKNAKEKFGFDQVTVNIYDPTKGSIPPHIDNVDAFSEVISSLSLNADTVMEFKREGNSSEEEYSVHIPARSFLEMTKESRYNFTHAIVARKSDYINGKQIFRNTEKPRISITYRKVTTLIPKVSLTKNLESSHVRNVYDAIADDFSRTRWNMWPKVAEFIKSLPKNILVADIGCGNGKYLDLLNDDNGREVIASDFSEGLIRVCQEKGRKANSMLVSDCLKCPLRDNLCDAVISIAVLHHLTSEKRRKAAIREILRILKPGGSALITVWAKDQSDAVYVDKEDQPEQEGSQNYNVNNDNNDKNFLKVHKNRTNFKDPDMLVPWKLNGKVYHRYYHIFVEGEFEELCADFEDCKIRSVELDNGNYVLIFDKVDVS